MKHSMLLHWELYIPGLDGLIPIDSKARWVAVSMMPWVSASVVLLTMLVETTSYLGVMEKTVVVLDHLSARWDTTGWRLGIHDSKFHIEPRKNMGFKKERPLPGVHFCFFFALQLWSSCQWVERISDTFYIWKFSWIRTIIRFPEWTKIEKMRLQ